ncbi:hypothetical protein ACHAC9_07670 [Massilia sp. CMS3.1]|uniref:hypothetical protein n=1 Tax=Massilia sp. CMS3.1 TaxID=3373083 RepID=UPI003EE7391B
MRIRLLNHALIVASLASGGIAMAALPKPAPTPAQQQAAAEKKAAADAQAAKAKEQLAASMDTLSTRWRSQAGTKGWTTHPPVAIAAAPVAGAPATGAAAAGVPAPGAAATNATPGTPLSGAVPAAVQTTGVAITGTPMPGVNPRVTGVSANTLTGTPAGNAAASPGGGAAPRSPQALQSANVPIKSEKLGTATPSADIKTEQTKAMPKGASPSVDRGNSKEVKN